MFRSKFGETLFAHGQTTVVQSILTVWINKLLLEALSKILNLLRKMHFEGVHYNHNSFTYEKVVFQVNYQRHILNIATKPCSLSVYELV